MFSRKIIKTAVLASLMMSSAAKAVDVFGYFTFDYDTRLSSDPKNNGNSERPGQFDTQFLALMFQHEHDIYKFFSEVEFFHAPEFVQADSTGSAGGDKLDGGWGAGSALKVERLYVDMAFHKAFNLRLGKSLPPLIWKSNHYPSIVKPITKPQVVEQGIAAGGYTGPQAFGQLGGGFNYNIWFYRNQYDDMVPKTGDTWNSDAFNRFARLAYKSEFAEGNFEISVINGTRENEALSSSRSEYDLNMTYKGFTLWFENASQNLGGASGDRTGMYAVASYSMDMHGKEFTPFLMYDTYKANKTSDDRVLTAIGLNYRPTPIVEHKVEYASIAKNGAIAGETWFKYQFVYFFN